MKLAAIYNVWDGVELLEGSINCLYDHVDVVVIVYQTVSNYGEHYDPLPDVDFSRFQDKIHLIKHDPHGHPRHNEIQKRNKGIRQAFRFKCTHFLTLDCDEYYQDFGAIKEAYMQSWANGSVVRLHTYFKEPTLMLETDENYFVPFIHKLDKNTMSGARNYPFLVDPTRRINETKVVELPYFMHHYSWVRKDVERKIRNSTAVSLRQSLHLHEYRKDLKAGDFLDCYQSRLKQVDNYFKIPNFGNIGATARN